MDVEMLAQYNNAPMVELQPETIMHENGVSEKVWNSRSPFTINDMTIEDHEASLSVASKLASGLELESNPRRGLYNTTEQSNQCKDCKQSE